MDCIHVNHISMYGSGCRTVPRPITHNMTDLLIIRANPIGNNPEWLSNEPRASLSVNIMLWYIQVTEGNSDSNSERVFPIGQVSHCGMSLPEQVS